VEKEEEVPDIMYADTPSEKGVRWSVINELLNPPLQAVRAVLAKAFEPNMRAPSEGCRHATMVADR
jgi:hypothetical protein